MTRDEILKMQAGPDIDSAVATLVMDWDIHPVSPDPYETELAWYSSDGKFQYADKKWCPSTDISVAWDVARKIGLFYQHAITQNRAGEFIIAKLYLSNPFDKYDIEEICKGDTALLAICRAALLAVME